MQTDVDQLDQIRRSRKESLNAHLLLEFRAEEGNRRTKLKDANMHLHEPALPHCSKGVHRGGPTIPRGPVMEGGLEKAL